MRTILAAALIACLSCGASARDAAIDPEGDISKMDETAKTQAEIQSKLAILMKTMQDAGFKDIQLSQALIVQAKDKSEKDVTLLLDPATMLAVELRSSPENETTGSGDENSEKNDDNDNPDGSNGGMNGGANNNDE